jgi:uncharacterized phosphosugar-binding protein
MVTRSAPPAATAMARFHFAVEELLNTVVEETGPDIRRVAQLLAGVVGNDHLLYVFGTGGHSTIAAEEMSWRAGGLAAVYPIFDPGVSIAFGARRSSAIERTPRYAQAVLGPYPITKDDVLIVANAYGINACTVDAALWARERGITTVGITSPGFSRKVPPDHPARHPTRKSLFEVVDYVLDTKMPERDAVLQFPGLRPWVAPVSTILNAFVIECLVAEIADALVKSGATPPIWTSGNIPGGDEANQDLIEHYARRIRWL